MNKGVGMCLILVSVFISGCMIHTHHVNVESDTRPKEMNLKYKILEVPLFAQTTRMWCWAASGEMIMHYYGEEVPQHVQANNRFNRGDCGAQTRSRNCIKGGWPQFHKYGFNPPKSIYGALSWQELVKQINAGQPVGFSWEWKKCNGRISNGSHYMVARGYIMSCDARMVIINDPLPQNSDKTKGGTVSMMTYSDYVQFCPRYIHSYTHYNITIDNKRKIPEKPKNITYAGSRATKSVRVNVRSRTQKQTAAIKSLEFLKALPWPVLKELGFESKQMAEKFTLGKPLNSSGIELRNTPAQGSGENPENIDEVHYPVNVDNEPVNSITLRKRNGKWALAFINEPGALCAIKARWKIPAPRGYTPDYFTVAILSMNLTFLAYFSGEDQKEESNLLYFVPIHEDPDLTFPLYVPVPAQEIFLELKYLLEQLAEEKGGVALKNKLTGPWQELDEALYDLESGVKVEVLNGMNQSLEIINMVFTQLGSRKESKND